MSRVKLFAYLVAATCWLLSSGEPAYAQEADNNPPAASRGVRGLWAEPRPLTKGFELAGKFLDKEAAEGDERKSGFYPELGNMVTGAGWISAGPGYRRWFGNTVLLDTSAGISWRAYKMAQARLEYTPFGSDRVAVGTQLRWQDLTQINYFGDGPDSRESDRSEYRLQSVNTIAYTTFTATPWLQFQGSIGHLSSPELGPPAGAFLRGNPPTYEVFPNDPVHQLGEQPSFLHGELAVVADTRDQPGHPLRGGVARLSWARYADRDGGLFSFGRYEAEAARFIPMAGDNVVLAFRGWVIGTTTEPGSQVPFYLAPSLGGNNTLRGYNDYRFHDRNMMVFNAEVRVAVFEHVDAVGLFDAGNVAARFGDLNFDKRSYGIGVRAHSATSTFARLDLARSEEGWQVVFRMNAPFNSSRFRKRTAQTPFAP
jgi:hypothetical protein